MRELKRIPIFPLGILPLPGEIVPLHIFEPRYRQLLEDLQAGDGAFGILYSGRNNEYQLGTVLNLQKILKKYPTGESDIVCKAGEVFLLIDYFRQMKDKLYAGGDVHYIDFPDFEVGKELEDNFRAYMDTKGQTDLGSPLLIHDIANELDLDITDRLKYLTILNHERREKFLIQRVKFRKHVLDRETITRNLFIYN